MSNLLVVFFVWVVGFGVLSFYLRDSVAALFIKRSRFPRYVNFLIIALLLVVIEEAFTCGSFPSCLIITVPAFWLHLLLFYVPLVLFGILRFRFWTIVLLYGLWGSFWEFIVDGKYTWFYEQGVAAFFVLVILNTLIYAVIAMLPVYYLKRSFSNTP